MLQIITTVYHSLEYSHLQYAIICWGNCFKIIKRKLQVKQNRIIKTLFNKFGAKTRLKPLYQQLQVLKLVYIEFTNWKLPNLLPKSIGINCLYFVAINYNF